MSKHTIGDIEEKWKHTYRESESEMSFFKIVFNKEEKQKTDCQ